jgi:FkbM family methyltransferase
MKQLAKQVASFTSERFQRTLKRYTYGRQIRAGRFGASEPEYAQLDRLVAAGDWVIDVGANIGHYTLRLAELVGPRGRVFAFEPIPPTFELLAANCALSPHRNITLFNAAVSEDAGVVSMVVPEWGRLGSRLNFSEARITADGGGSDAWSVLTLRVDDLGLPRRIGLIKVDAEGHEAAVIRGMARLIERDRPVIIAEGTAASALLESLGYEGRHQPDSPNYTWHPRAAEPAPR